MFDASVIRVGGAYSPLSPPPLGVSLPAPNGVGGTFMFLADTWAEASMNLSVPKTYGELVGDPTLMGGYAHFPGMGAHLDTLLAEEADIGVLALAQNQPGTAGNRRIANNMGSNSSDGISLHITSGNVLRFDVATTSGANIAGTVSGVSATDWVMVSAKVGGLEKRTRLISAGTSANATLAAPRKVTPPPETLVIGSLRPGGALGNFPLNVFGVIFTLGRAPSDDEEDANARVLRDIAAAYGISVTVP